MQLSETSEYQPRFEKSTFLLILIAAAVLLLMLPFLTTFNEFLTKIVESFGWYRWVQNWIVPWESKMVGALLAPFGVDYQATLNGMVINGTFLRLTWNCIGWQSLILMVITLFTGLTGRYSRTSKIEVALLGLLGIFLINLFRLAFTAWLGAYFGHIFAIVFHDYFATFITLAFLFVFWWFAYRFVLESKT